MADRPTIVTDTDAVERTITERYGEAATDRAVHILATVRVAHNALRRAATPKEMRELSDHYYTVMRNAARTAHAVPGDDRSAIRALAELQDDEGLVRMIDDPRLADPDAGLR